MAEVTLPRIMLALAPTDPGEMFGCPGRAGDDATFLMTVQEEPLALDGPSSEPWPVGLRPMTVDASESACYPDWEFLRAGWTAAGRTFEARVGFAQAATMDERDDVLAAFASMTFSPSSRGVTAAVLGDGIAGGEPWTLFAQRTGGGLSLSLEAETIGAGTSLVTPATSELQPASTVLGQGSTNSSSRSERSPPTWFGSRPRLPTAPSCRRRSSTYRTSSTRTRTRSRSSPRRAESWCGIRLVRSGRGTRHRR